MELLTLYARIGGLCIGHTKGRITVSLCHCYPKTNAGDFVASVSVVSF